MGKLDPGRGFSDIGGYFYEHSKYFRDMVKLSFLNLL